MRRFISALTMIILLALAGATCFSGAAQASFGFKSLEVSFPGPDGNPLMQAGSHPFGFATTVNFNTFEAKPGNFLPEGELRDLTATSPPGLVGDPTAVPRCPTATFIATVSQERERSCPDPTAVGIAAVDLNFVPEPPTLGYANTSAVYNLPPPPGVAARLGFFVVAVPVIIDVRVSPDPPYRLLASVDATSQITQFFGSRITIWGNPSDPAHDAERGLCAELHGSTCPVQQLKQPFLTAPRSCTGALTSEFAARAWNTGAEASGVAVTPLGFSGCAKLGFGPTISAQPTTKAANSPTGLDFSLDVDDEGLTNPTGIADSDIKKAVVTLPEGFSTNPSLAEGLEVCSEADLARESAFSAPGAGCPDASKIGTVEVETPLLEENVDGSLFIAKPYENQLGQPPRPLRRDQEPDPGHRHQAGAQGRTRPGDRPAHHHRRRPAAAPLLPLPPPLPRGRPITAGSPPGCGTYTASAELTPWSGGPPITTTSAFQIISGPDAGPCPSGGLPPFHPHLDAGTLNKRRRALLAPSTSASPAPTPNRRSPTSRSSCPRACSASSPASPSAPMRRSPPANGEDRTARRPGRARQPQLPGGLPGRPHPRRRRRRAIARLRPRQDLPRRPLPRSPGLASSRSPPAWSAPSTSAPSSSAWRSTSTPKPAKSSSTRPARTRSPTSSRASRSTCATSAPTPTAPNSPSTRPAANRPRPPPRCSARALTSSRRRRQPARRLDPLPGRRLRRPALQAQAHLDASRARPSAAATRASAPIWR